MNSEHSSRLEAAIKKAASMMDVGGEADAGRSFEDDENEDCVELGFDLAMKLVQMSAMEKYAGKSLQVFYADEDADVGGRFYFIGVDEDEVVARVEAL